MADSVPGIMGVSMVSVYAVDFEASLRFYRDVLGLADVQPMGERAAYFRFGRTAGGEPYGMYLVGGRTRPPETERPTRATFAFDVPSARATFDHLKAEGVRLAMEEPMDMGSGWFWFTAFDPSGVPVEFLGKA